MRIKCLIFPEKNPLLFCFDELDKMHHKPHGLQVRSVAPLCCGKI